MSTLTITASTLNVREAPTKDSKVLIQLPRHFHVQQLEKSGDGQWFRIQATTRDVPVSGWISAKYAVEEAPAAPAAAPADEFPWLKIARAEIGVTEVPGEKDNPRIEEYHAATSLRADHDEVPWCSAFVNWCMKQAGQKRTNLANARSWLDWGRAIDKPVHGCVAVLKRSDDPTKGHVAFYMETEGDNIVLLGGNQGNAVKLSRYPAARVISYRLPV